MFAQKILNKLNHPVVYLLLIVSLGFGFRALFSLWQVRDGGKESTQALFATVLPDENGVQKSLGQYRGKTVVLNFWATWCEPCREEMPELSALHQAHEAEDVVVLGLAIDDIPAIHDFVKSNPVSYPIFSAEDDGMSMSTSLGNSKAALPYTVIIKPNGTLAKTYFGRVSKALLEQTLADLHAQKS